MSKSQSAAQQALALLDDLDFSVDDVPQEALDQPHQQANEAEDALQFLNDLTQKSSTTSRPPTSSSTPAPPAAPPAPSPAAVDPSPAPPAAAAAVDAPAQSSSADEPLNIPSSSPPPPAAGGGGWGWSSSSSLWSTASSALSSARTQAELLQKDAARQLQASLDVVASDLKPEENLGKVVEDGRKLGWGGVGALKGWVEKGVERAGQGVDLEKLRNDLLLASQSSLSNLLATIAPPIAEHEVIEVWLTHDMVGYAGVEGVVYRGLAKILEQVEGGELVVNSSFVREHERGGKHAGGEEEREMHAVHGWEKALELAHTSVEQLIESRKKEHLAKGSSTDGSLPVHTTPVYLRIQPVLHSSPFPSTSTSAAAAAAEGEPDQLSFLLHLTDPSHSLTHTVQTQPIPTSWLAVPWASNGWVEERLVDALRVGVEVVGEGYVMERMGVVGSSSAGSGAGTPKGEVEQGEGEKKE